MEANIVSLGRKILLEQGNGTSSSSSSSSSPNHGGAYGSNTEASFDTNMVIILAALLCALICALGLNSIVRCALRCGRGGGGAAAAAERGTAAAAGRGLKKSALRRIPVAAYGAAASSVGTDCAICLGEFEAGERVRVLPLCSHGFHVRCIDPWLASHSSCPTCRRSLALDHQSAAAAAAAAIAIPVAGNENSSSSASASASDRHQVVAVGSDEAC